MPTFWHKQPPDFLTSLKLKFLIALDSMDLDTVLRSLIKQKVNMREFALVGAQRPRKPFRKRRRAKIGTIQTESPKPLGSFCSYSVQI